MGTSLPSFGSLALLSALALALPAQAQTSDATPSEAAAAPGGDARAGVTEGGDALASPSHRTGAATSEGDAEGECADEAPVFDPSTPRLELQVSGGYAAFFHTWRQTSDSFMAPGAHADGLYYGPVFRGEVAFAMGSLSLAAIYTHTWLAHDGTADPVQFGFLSGELGLQCACRGSTYVWSFGLEVGADLANAGRTTVFVSIEHRSMFYVWEGLFLGFDVDFATFIGLTSGGASGGGIIGNLLVGYSFG
jgi:hypothetical protein